MLSLTREPSSASTVDFLSADDMPREFYVILAGEVGVFVPRPQSHIVAEMSAVERMCRRLDQTELDADDIQKYLKTFKEEKDRKEFLTKVVRVWEGKSVQLNKEHIQEKLGNLPNSRQGIYNFYNEVEKSNFSTDT